MVSHWSRGKQAEVLRGDVTVIDTLATSYLASTSVTPGSAAEIAAARKEDKYINLITTHTFVPIALETMGPISAKSLAFLRELGRRLARTSDDPRESTYLFQRLSVAIQRFNAVCVAAHWVTVWSLHRPLLDMTVGLFIISLYVYAVQH
jgi:hypothetical protein